MQYIRCLNSDCRYCEFEQCKMGLITVNRFGLCAVRDMENRSDEKAK